MRKWLWIGTVTAAFAIAVGSWYGAKKSSRPDTGRDTGQHEEWVLAPLDLRGEGDAEASDTIEPLVVDSGVPAVQGPEPPVYDGPMERVLFFPGVSQPQRPDAEPGKALRMPYADEEEIFDALRNPLTRVLDADSSRPTLFDEFGKVTPAEESEEPEVIPPAPMPDYHQQYQHCPYSGGRCPTYPIRTMPRE